MVKEKIIPIVITVVLLIAIVVILIVNKNNKMEFSELNISYHNENISHTDIEIDNVFVIDNVSFWIVSKAKNEIVLNSSDDITYNNKKKNEIKLVINKAKEICFADNSCALLELK